MEQNFTDEYEIEYLEEINWNLDDVIYEQLGPSAGEIIEFLKKLKLSRDQCRDRIIDYLGPSSDDILKMSKGRIFDDEEETYFSEEETYFSDEEEDCDTDEEEEFDTSEFYDSKEIL